MTVPVIPVSRWFPVNSLILLLILQGELAAAGAGRAEGRVEQRDGRAADRHEEEEQQQGQETTRE